MAPLLSLVTGTRNRQESFNRLLSSVVLYTSVDWELVVSDAGDSPVQVPAIAASRVRLLPERPRLGCTLGYNRAFRECLGEWVIWLNDDAEVMPDYDVEAISFMEAHPMIGLGALHYSNRGGPFTVNTYADMVYANFGIIRRSIGDSIGWFDEDLTMYGCDNSITFRVLLAELGVAPIARARLVHHEEPDQLRIENQAGRYSESDKLREKYLPRKEQMLRTYMSSLAQL